MYFLSYQQIKGDEDGARGESDLRPGRGQFPHQEYAEGHIRHKQQNVPESHPKTEN